MSNSQPLALVTGGAGFIGSHLTEALVSLGCQVRVLDNLSSGRAENLSRVRAKIDFRQADIRDQKALNQAMTGVRVVFHLAALTSVSASLSDPALYLDVDAMGSLAVFQAASQARAQRLVLASTSAIYGDGPCPQAESQAPQVDNPYAAAKLLAENLGVYFQRNHHLEVISLRLFNVYGPRQSLTDGEASVIALFAQAALTGQSPIIYGDGEQTRDFIEARDVVRALILAGRTPYPKSGVYNVGTGQAISINRLAQLLKELVPDLPRPIYRPTRLGDSLQSMADMTKSARNLQFSAHIDIREGLAALLAQQKPEKKSPSFSPAKF